MTLSCGAMGLSDVCDWYFLIKLTIFEGKIENTFISISLNISFACSKDLSH